MKRISYYWKRDVVYTFKWTFLISTLFELCLLIALNFNNLIISELLIDVLVFAVFMSTLNTLILGFRPYITLYSKINSFTLDEYNNLYVDNVILSISLIDQIDKIEFGSGFRKLKYYEIRIKSVPDNIQTQLNKNGTIICFDLYSIKGIFSDNDDFIDHLITIGLDPSIVISSRITLWDHFKFITSFKKKK